MPSPANEGSAVELYAFSKQTVDFKNVSLLGKVVADPAMQVGNAASGCCCHVHVCHWPARRETPDWLKNAPCYRTMHL